MRFYRAVTAALAALVAAPQWVAPAAAEADPAAVASPAPPAEQAPPPAPAPSPPPQDTEAQETEAQAAGAQEPAAAPTETPDGSSRPASPPPPKPKFEAAVGLRIGYGPEYMGASSRGFDWNPAIYLRYGRLSLSSASGLVDRRDDDVLRGLGLDLSRTERLRLGVSLRFDQGRDDDGKKGLNGTGEVPSTIRARFAAQRRFDGGWRLSAALSPDLLGRGGGTTLDIGVSREQRLSPTWRWNAGASLSWADQRYMRSYFGVSEQEAATSGLPAYQPSSGWRDLGVGARARYDVSRVWSTNAGCNVTRILGPARDSPLTNDTLTLGCSVGAIWWY